MTITVRNYFYSTLYLSTWVIGLIKLVISGNVRIYPNTVSKHLHMLLGLTMPKAIGSNGNRSQAKNFSFFGEFVRSVTVFSLGYSENLSSCEIKCFLIYIEHTGP